MKKQTIALLPVGFILGLSVLVLTTFQNCSNVTFGSTKEASESILAIAQKNCTDVDGTEHLSGDTWTTSENELRPVVCPDSTDSQQGYENGTSWICQNGDISIAGNDTKLVAPMSSCPAPALTASASNPMPLSGGSSNLLVTSQAVHDVKYDCRSVATGSSISSGNLSVGSAQATIQTIVEDLKCSVSAQTSGDPIVKTVDIGVDCESSGRLKDPTTHTCVDFTCKSYVALDPISSSAGLKFEVPARTSAGICYTVKLMDAIANSKSDLNKTHDMEIVSANHSGSGTWNPWLMGSANVEFLMKAGGGARQVKLSSSGQKASAITVDNFVLTGLAKKSVGLTSNDVYRSYGTKDSTVDKSNIRFRNQNLPLTGFGSAGTTSIGTLDITTQVSTEESYVLDVRALDCGGSREMSDIYLLFQ
jgi:hypothetical protein